MDHTSEMITRLGHGRQDIAIGSWESCDDVASFTFVRYPQQDTKYCMRELLRLLGKRFPTAEATLMWQAIESYREGLAQLFGPASGTTARLNFEQAAHQWYDLYGPAFEKQWYLRASIDVNVARTGQERIRGRWLVLVHPKLWHFIRAGLFPENIWYELKRCNWRGHKTVLTTLWRTSEKEQVLLWTELAARLSGYALSEAELSSLMPEIIEHTARLSHRQNYPLEPTVVAIDFFARLALAGLNTTDILATAPI